MDALGALGGYATQGPMGRNTAVRIVGISDGTSNTVLVGECSSNAYQPRFRSWVRGPSDVNYAMGSAKNLVTTLNARTPPAAFNDGLFGSNHAGVTQFLFCDGSVRPLPDSTKRDTLFALASYNAGEVVTE